MISITIHPPLQPGKNRLLPLAKRAFDEIETGLIAPVVNQIDAGQRPDGSPHKQNAPSTIRRKGHSRQIIDSTNLQQTWHTDQRGDYDRVLFPGIAGWKKRSADEVLVALESQGYEVIGVNAEMLAMVDATLEQLLDALLEW